MWPFNRLSRFGRGPTITVTVVIRGRIGEGWYEIDRPLRIPEGASLEELIACGEKQGIPFAEVLEKSPHLRDTLMINGERCSVPERGGRTMDDGDELYLLAPIAGG